MLSLAKGFLYYYEGSPVQIESFTDVPENNDYFIYVENAVKQKIINAGGEFKGSEAITCEEFAKLLVKTIGYSDIAEYSDIFKLDGIKALDGKSIGYIAVCKALGILPLAEDGSYDGSKGITYAEAAVSLYKALSYVK